MLKIQEGELNVSIDTLLEPAAFPEPSSVNWFQNVQPLRERSGLTTTCHSIMFSSVMQSDAGNYTVNAID